MVLYLLEHMWWKHSLALQTEAGKAGSSTDAMHISMDDVFNDHRNDNSVTQS